MLRNAVQCSHFLSEFISYHIFYRHPNGKESADLTVHFMPIRNVLTELFIKVFGGYTVE